MMYAAFAELIKQGLQYLAMLLRPHSSKLLFLFSSQNLRHKLHIISRTAIYGNSTNRATWYFHTPPASVVCSCSSLPIVCFYEPRTPSPTSTPVVFHQSQPLSWPYFPFPPSAAVFGAARIRHRVSWLSIQRPWDRWGTIFCCWVAQVDGACPGCRLLVVLSHPRIHPRRNWFCPWWPNRDNDDNHEIL